MTVIFFVNGVLLASWTAHIPHVKASLGLDDGALGIALLGAPAGSVLAMLLTARLIARMGSRRMVRITLVGYCLAGPVVGLTGSLVGLFLALAAWGAFQGTLDVSMNTQAISVERRAGHPLMPGFHAWWSIGAFAGAAVGALGVAAGLSLSGQLAILALPCLLAGGWLATQMIPDVPPAEQAKPPALSADPLALPADLLAPAGPRQTRARQVGTADRAAWLAILMLGAIAVADMLCEGAAADWAAVYLRTTLGTAPAVAGLGYACYSLAMVGVRLSGNRLLARFTAHRLLPFLAAAATVLFAARPGRELRSAGADRVRRARRRPCRGHTRGVQRGRPGARHQRGHRGVHGLGVRLGRLRPGPRADRPARRGHVTAHRAHHGADPDRPDRGVHRHLPRATRALSPCRSTGSTGPPVSWSSRSAGGTAFRTAPHQPPRTSADLTRCTHHGARCQRSRRVPVKKFTT